MSIKVNTLAAAINAYVTVNKDVVKADFARALNVEIDKYCKKVTKIQGAYHVLHSLMTHVVQGFKPQWNALGEFHVKDKELKNYHQKVNFKFQPAAILGTLIAEMYEENKKPTDKEIAKRIMDWIMTQITDDVALLSMTGSYDAGQLEVFGHSVNGFNTLISELLSNTARPCYHIPMQTITDTNAVDQLMMFERQLPKIFKAKIKQIHCSSNVKEMYGIDYFNSYGVNPSYTDSDKLKSPLGKREIVGHDDMADNVIFATIDGNMLNLIDLNNPATITDIQTLDYDVKVFGEFWKGWDFLINEAVCVGDFSEAAFLGLGNDDMMKLYFPHNAVDVVPVPMPKVVVVLPNDVEIAQSGENQFFASVLPAGSDQSVTWSIEPVEAGVTVDTDGKVTIDATGAVGTYTLSATSDEYDNVVGTASFDVIE